MFQVFGVGVEEPKLLITSSEETQKHFSPYYDSHDDSLTINKWQDSFSDALILEWSKTPHLHQYGSWALDEYGFAFSDRLSENKATSLVHEQIDQSAMAIQLAMKRSKDQSSVAPENSLTSVRLRNELFNKIANTTVSRRSAIYHANGDGLAGYIWQRENPRVFENYFDNIRENSAKSSAALQGTAGANIRSYTDESFLEHLKDHFKVTDLDVGSYVHAYSKIDMTPQHMGNLFKKTRYIDGDHALIQQGIPAISGNAYYDRIEEVHIGKLLKESFPSNTSANHAQSSSNSSKPRSPFAQIPPEGLEGYGSSSATAEETAAVKAGYAELLRKLNLY